jgi:hypothetical protein
VPIPAGPDPIPGGVDYLTVHLDVHPYDGTTSATLEVRPPAPAVAFSPGPCTATVVSVEIAGVPTAVQRWTAPPVPTPGPYGWWVLAWTVTGTGSQAPEESVYVPPPPIAGRARVDADPAVVLPPTCRPVRLFRSPTAAIST